VPANPNLDACLPAALRGPATTIAPIAAGLSGAGVYRVDAGGGQTFVLKISRDDETAAAWRRRLHIRRLAADAGLTPRVVHADESRLAVLSDFVADRSFPAYYANSGTRAAALALLGRTLRRVHALPSPPEAEPLDVRAFLARTWERLAPRFATPAFAGDAIARMLAAAPPPSERALVLSHNDVNPSNLIFDGERLLLLDWESAAPNDPFFDLAAISVFARMDEATSATLLAAYDEAPPAPLPPRFAHHRRLAAITCGTLMLYVAQRNGHAGAAGDETLASTPSLAGFYARIFSGSLDVATAEGQWCFGLALIKESAAL